MSNFNIGSKHRILNGEQSGHGFEPGTVVTLTKIDSDGDLIMTDAQGEWWFVKPEEVEAVHERPLIDFSDKQRDRSAVRANAANLISRVNKTETNDVLRLIADGWLVDAYVIQAVLADVFSGCATRAAQSPGRRKHTKQARSIAHIVTAVLSNHADGLPPMEPGARSPRIAELEAEVSDLQGQVAEANRIRSARNEEITEVRLQRDAALAEVSALTGYLSDARAERNDVMDALAASEQSAAGLRETLVYALRILDTTDRESGAQVRGFGDAYSVDAL